MAHYQFCMLLHITDTFSDKLVINTMTYITLDNNDDVHMLTLWQYGHRVSKILWIHHSPYIEGICSRACGLH